MRNRMASAALPLLGMTVDRTVYVSLASLIQPLRRSITKPPVIDPDRVIVACPYFTPGARLSVPETET